MASYGAHHRTASSALCCARTGRREEFIGTKNDVLVLSSSGTGFMEARSNLTFTRRPGARADRRKFGERWTSLARRLRAPWRQ